MPRRQRRRFSAEFKAEAVRVAQQSDEPISQLAKAFGVPPRSLRDWLEAARPSVHEPRLTEDERSELLRLRRENQQLRTERDILKKATAFFARQNE
jgi:transposase